MSIRRVRTHGTGWGGGKREDGDRNSQSVSVVLRVHGKPCVHELVLLFVHRGVAAGGGEGVVDDERVRGRRQLARRELR